MNDYAAAGGTPRQVREAISRLSPGLQFSMAGLVASSSGMLPSTTAVAAEITSYAATEAWAPLRSRRNADLARTDWTQGGDAAARRSAKQIADLAVWRQALCNLPETYGTPDSAIDLYPVEP